MGSLHSLIWTSQIAASETTSLHWAVAQLGVGQTEIEAVSLPERIFSILAAWSEGWRD